MKQIYFFLFVLALITSAKSSAQSILPVGFAPGEEQKSIFNPGPQAASPNTYFTQPPGSHIRTAAEWEEIQALTITWTSYPAVLAEVIHAAQTEAQVYIICGNTCSGSTDSLSIKSYLQSLSIPLVNLHFIYAPCNSVWMRDYGQNTVYGNTVDSLMFVEWKYNRPRPDDDTVPRSIGRAMHIPDYEMSQGATTLVATGGNWMSDGFGTAFGSNLTINENPSLTSAQIDKLAHDWMGVNRYVHMPTLPYDQIHHIDMHMKLIDEETILMGQYPNGISDGPQIEANLQYVLSNYNSVFGTPYKVIRIPQPPDQSNGNIYPNAGGDYLTYANATFINKTVILPQYYAQYDTTALRIWRKALPGYRIYGIDCNITIPASGALHCITHSVGVADPLLISHQALPNTSNTSTPYQVNAKIMHRSGIATANVYYRTDTTQPYVSAAMTLTIAGSNTWTGFIPAKPVGTHVYYYIQASSVSGKTQVRPMPAPAGYWRFDVLGPAGIQNNPMGSAFLPAYPNPSHGITCIPVNSLTNTKGSITLMDLTGREVSRIFEGEIPAGDKNYFLDSSAIPAGAYLIVLRTEEGTTTEKLMVR
jgi:agmatine deiminase